MALATGTGFEEKRENDSSSRRTKDHSFQNFSYRTLAMDDHGLLAGLYTRTLIYGSCNVVRTVRL